MIRNTLTAVLLASASIGAQDESPVLEKLRAFERTLQEQLQAGGGGLVMSKIKGPMDEVLGAIDVPELSPEEVVEVAASRFLMRFGGVREGIAERLRDVQQRDDALGAQAACAVLLIDRQDWVATARERARRKPKVDVASDMDEQVAAVRRVLAHPAMDAAMRQGKSKDFFSAMHSVIHPVRKRILPDLIALERYLDGEPSPVLLHGMTGMVRSTLGITDLAQSDDLLRLRARLSVAIAEHDLATVDAPGLREDLEEDLEWLRADVATPEELEGAEAPELDFNWSRGELDARKLSELRGKPVVLDFWAWWCRGCITSFPSIAELASEYEGRVVFLGVTSLQGRMPAEGELVDTKQDPEREYELLESFLVHHDVTWPVVATEQPVINRDYGVFGLPAVVVVDKDGVVHKTGLHMSDQDSVRRVLDALLE